MLSAGGTTHAFATVRQKSMAVANDTAVLSYSVDSYRSCMCAIPLSQSCYTPSWPSSFQYYLNFKRFFHQSSGKNFEDWMSSQMSLSIGPSHHYCPKAGPDGIYCLRLLSECKTFFSLIGSLERLESPEC